MKLKVKFENGNEIEIKGSFSFVEISKGEDDEYLTTYVYRDGDCMDDTWGDEFHISPYPD